jgi:uroporphyrinogen-III synthase
MFTSPLTVKNLIKVARENDNENMIDVLRNGEVLVAAIGPITKKVMDAYKIEPIMPEEYTFKNMLDKLVEVIKSKRNKP